MTKRKEKERKSISFNEKCSLLEAYDKVPKTSQRDAVAKLLWDAVVKQQAFETAALYFETVNKIQ